MPSFTDILTDKKVPGKVIGAGKSSDGIREVLIREETEKQFILYRFCDDKLIDTESFIIRRNAEHAATAYLTNKSQKKLSLRTSSLQCKVKS